MAKAGKEKPAVNPTESRSTPVQKTQSGQRAAESKIDNVGAAKCKIA